MPGRIYTSSDQDYKFGFNAQEEVDEIAGKGNHTTALFWEYDTRTARRWNRDPKPNPSYSEYSTFALNPILFSDILGDTVIINLHHPKDPLYHDANNIVKKQKNDGFFLVIGHADFESVLDPNLNVLTETTDIHKAIIDADNAQNFITINNEDGSASKVNKYGGDSYELQVNNSEKVSVILYGCNTASTSANCSSGCDKVPDGTDENLTSRYSDYLSERNKRSKVTGANGLVKGKGFWNIPTEYDDNPKSQKGAWITYQNGNPKYFKKVKYNLEKGQKYVTPATKVKLGKRQKISPNE